MTVAPRVSSVALAQSVGSAPWEHCTQGFPLDGAHGCRAAASDQREPASDVAPLTIEQVLTLAPWRSAAGVSAREFGALDVERPRRRTRARLRDAIRPAYPLDENGFRLRPAACGYQCNGGSASVVRYSDGAAITGVVTCRSPWVCPVCSGRILAERRAQIADVVGWARDEGHSLCLVTFTMRHGWGDDVGRVIRGLAAAWTEFWRGRAGQTMKGEIALVGWVRRLEVTHGPSGFHPHIHAIFVTRRPMTGDDWETISRRWRACVIAQVGDEHAPTFERGVDFSEVGRDGRYVAKMGLEVADDLMKQPKPGHRSIWQVGASAGAGNARDRAAWLAFFGGTKGVRLLTWSQGRHDLRKLAGIDDEDDEEIEEHEQGTEVARIERADWRELRAIPDAVDVVLTVAEGGRDVGACVREILQRTKGARDS
jgi:hypothetical protein